jgi:carbonic anhydrase
MRVYHSYEELIGKNGVWAAGKLEQDPTYFERLSRIQKPPFLFIGCSDSRMPIDTFTQTDPGELFIHRNIANQIHQTDMNFLTVLEYAIEVLQVKHIIVCGHYHCGGIEAAYRNNARGLAENWIGQIKDIIREHKAELEAIADLEPRLDRLAELNVIAQAKNLFRVSAFARLVEKGGYYPTVHGWVLNIREGRIKDLELPFGLWKAEGIVPEGYDGQEHAIPPDPIP